MNMYQRTTVYQGEKRSVLIYESEAPMEFASMRYHMATEQYETYARITSYECEPFFLRTYTPEETKSRHYFYWFLIISEKTETVQLGQKIQQENTELKAAVQMMSGAPCGTNVITTAKRARASFVALAQYAPDTAAVSNLGAYDFWSGESVPYAAGYKVRHGAQLYKCRSSHTSQPEWTPVQAPALWEVISQTCAGTPADPIPAAAGMAYEKGLCYREGDTVYQCTRDTEQPVYNLPSELIGIYFEIQRETEA